jgi:hypothetical protein
MLKHFFLSVFASLALFLSLFLHDLGMIVCIYIFSSFGGKEVEKNETFYAHAVTKQTILRLSIIIANGYASSVFTKSFLCIIFIISILVWRILV